MTWLIKHSLLLLLILAGALTYLWLWLQRHRLRLRPGWIPVLAAGHVLVGVLCVKLFAILEAGSLSKAGNMSLFGAVFFLPLVYYLGGKLTGRRMRDVFDVFVLPMVVTLACARVNCLISGCCLGKPIPGTDLRWPTRELELVFYVVLLAWMLLRTRRKNTDGILYPTYMIAYGIFRFVIEFFREGADSLFHLAHLWALLSLMLGAGFFLEARRLSRSSKPTPRIHRRKRK